MQIKNVSDLEVPPQDRDALELAPLKEAIEAGAKEIARVWLSNKEGGAVVMAQVRQFFDAPMQWAMPLGALAVVVSRGVEGLDDQAEQSTLASLILLRAAQQQPGFNEAFKHFQKNFLPREERDRSEHPGMMPVIPQVLDEPDAKQVLAVWEIPEHLCDNCDEIHPAEIYFGGMMSNVEPEELGNLLAQMARAYTKNVVSDEARQFATETRIMKGFIEYMNGNLERA